LNDALSEWLGRSVHLVSADRHGPGTFECRSTSSLMIRALRWEGPDYSFVDSSQVHVLTTSSVHMLEGERPDLDCRCSASPEHRDEAPDRGPLEMGWIGRQCGSAPPCSSPQAEPRAPSPSPSDSAESPSGCAGTTTWREHRRSTRFVLTCAKMSSWRSRPPGCGRVSSRSGCSCRPRGRRSRSAPDDRSIPSRAGPGRRLDHDVRAKRCRTNRDRAAHLRACAHSRS